MAVPGCTGGEEEDSKTDFCTLATMANSTFSPSSPVAPTITLESATASPSAPLSSSSVLVASPTVAPSGVSTPAPTVVVFLDETPTTIAAASINASVATVELDIVGTNGEPPENYPLGLCQGDCDSDDDCQDGLICFFRDPDEPVPGCLGDDSSRSDYCIPDPNALPAASPTLDPNELPAEFLTITPDVQPAASPSVSSFPFPTSVAPTVNIGSSASLTTTAPTLSLGFSDYPSTVPSDFPSFVPTITPVPTNSEQPTGAPTGGPTAEPRQGVQLKLYWQEGYLWQDETIERKCTFLHGTENLF